jgi:hypothetical protein
MTEKENKMDDPEDKIDVLCRIHLKIESGIYAVLGFILSLPVLLVAVLVKGAVWLVTHAIPALLWFVTTIIMPVFTFIINIIITTGKLLIKLLKYLFPAIIRLIKRLIRWINWCIVRSVVRTFAILAEIVSIAFIINGFLHFSLSEIVTGEYYDVNPDITFIHSMIIISLLSVLLYYSAWAWSRPEETELVCKYTRRFFPSVSMFDRIWK